MFIGWSVTPEYLLRSEERNSTRASPLESHSAPPNGAERPASRAINISPLRGKYRYRSRTREVEIKHSEEIAISVQVSVNKEQEGIDSS
jgi:hypothetical protein